MKILHLVTIQPYSSSFDISITFYKQRHSFFFTCTTHPPGLTCIFFPFTMFCSFVFFVHIAVLSRVETGADGGMRGRLCKSTKLGLFQ